MLLMFSYIAVYLDNYTIKIGCHLNIYVDRSILMPHVHLKNNLSNFQFRNCKIQNVAICSLFKIQI